MSKTLTFKASAWLMPDSDIRNVREDNARITSDVTYLPLDARVEYWSSIGYVYVGEATITLERAQPTAEAIQAQVAALRELASKERAAGEARARAIEDRIGNLLCLEAS